MLDIICLGIIKDLPSTNLFRSEEIIYIYLDMSRIYPLLYFLRSEKSLTPQPPLRKERGSAGYNLLGNYKRLALNKFV